MCNSNLSSNPCDQICKKQVAYDKAVEAYQFHVQRYHTWVNYYAIFVGALFVAFYTIIPQSENVQCTPCSGTIFSFLTRVRDKDCVKNRVKRAKIVRFTLC